jgi:hypothetical protein
MWSRKTGTGVKIRSITVERRRQRAAASPVLVNLLRDTSAPVLVYLGEQLGLRRVPGLDRTELIARLLRQLDADQLQDLEDRLIAAHYGGLSVGDLLQRALESGEQRTGRAGGPRLDEIDAGDATLVEGGSQRWMYTMRGHDVVIDMAHHILACDCPFFAFASHRQVLCKHLAMGFKLIPEVYARDALIDLLVAREYGGPQGSRWTFRSLEAA